VNPKSKTVWEQWVEKVEAAWPITATEIAMLCVCDYKTATRIRDHIASVYGQEPLRGQGGARKVMPESEIIDELGRDWPVSLDDVAKRYRCGRTVARRLQREAIAKHRLEPNLHKAKHAIKSKEVFAKLDQYLAEHDGKTNRLEMRALTHCTWETYKQWKIARGIYRETKLVGRAVERKAIAERQLPKRLRPAVVEAVASKPQHYAPGRWFRSKRSGEIVPALFVVSGSEVKFFGVTT
jgi:hypothetical protein